mgnify:CR=1 FL=1
MGDGTGDPTLLAVGVNDQVLTAEGSLSNPLFLGNASSWENHLGMVDTTASYYRVGKAEGGWWTYLWDVTGEVDFYVYGDNDFSSQLLCSSTNACLEDEKCDLEGNGTSSRYLMVDGSKSEKGATFTLNVQP